MAEVGIAEVRSVLAAHSPLTHPSETSKRRAAVAVLLREGPEQRLETLFIQRAINPLDPWSGHMAFPGGHQEPVDSSLEAAAQRETFEEVGLRLTSHMRIGRLHDLSGGRLANTGLTVSPFIYHFRGQMEMKLSEEVADAVWIPLGYLADPRNVQPYTYHLDPLQRNFPSFQYQSYTIWGMTFRMMGSFLELFDIRLPDEDPLSEVE